MERILVLGGVSGIGEAVAKRLQEQHPDAELIVPRRLEWSGGLVTYELDIRDEESIEGFLYATGPFTHIVYTPGVNHLAYVESLSSTDFMRDYSVNAFGFALLLGKHSEMFGKEALKSAVAITSDAARNAMRGSLVYCSSKAALEAIVRVIAREWAPHTRVNGVAPAIVADTPMTEYIDATVPGFRGWEPEKALAYEKSMLPMGRRIRKEEVAEVVEHVLFGPAYQTGSIINITGGK